MRHRKKKNKIRCSASHRKALTANMIISLILHSKLVTTEGKARIVASEAESFLSRACSESDSRKRKLYLHQFLNNDAAEKKVVTDLVKKYANKKSGFVRVLKIGARKGDGARTCQIELI
ncbi:hypothetical protein KKC60_01375 [Patescibacteria group bacterium]|nr:hypothetical protein [Patescibacteria group bacterium]